MKRSNKLVFSWKDIGQLKILFRRTQSATLRFNPSAAAIKKAVKGKGRHKGAGKYEGNK